MFIIKRKLKRLGFIMKEEMLKIIEEFQKIETKLAGV